MMSSWYQNQDNNDDDESGSPNDNLIIDYKLQYQQLKKKLKFLIYENEFFQDNLKTSQRRLLKVTRDKSYLLDRLITHEYSSTESEFSDSSDDETADSNKRRKADSGVVMTGKNIIMPNQRMPKKRPIIKKHPNVHSNVNMQMNHHQQHNPGTVENDEVPLEEVARHLQSRPTSFLELAVPGAHTVPQEMFSNEPSLDSESNE